MSASSIFFFWYWLSAIKKKKKKKKKKSDTWCIRIFSIKFIWFIVKLADSYNIFFFKLSNVKCKQMLSGAH